MAYHPQNFFSAEETFVLDYIKGKYPVFHPDYSAQAIQVYAARNGLSPYLFHLIKEKKEAVSDELYALLKKDYLNSFFRNTRIQNAWNDIRALLDANELSYIPLKGIFIASHIYPDSSIRPMSDLDILLLGDGAHKAFDLLLKHGGEIGDEEPAEHDKKTGHHLQAIIYKGVMIELHTSLFPLDMNYQIPNRLIEQHLMQYKGTNTLPPMLNLCYLCLHAYSTMRRGGTRLSWFLDLKLLAESPYFASDKTDLEALIRSINITHPVIDVLMKAEFLFDYRFPFVPDKLRKTLSAKETSHFISFIRNSEQQDTSHSYAIAFERLRNTKGLRGKFAFIRSVITKGGNKNAVAIAKRLWRLSKRVTGMIFKKYT